MVPIMRNRDIDNCMKAFQLRVFAYKDTIEWIPFDKLSDVQEIGYIQQYDWIASENLIEIIIIIKKQQQQYATLHLGFGLYSKDCIYGVMPYIAQEVYQIDRLHKLQTFIPLNHNAKENI
ncbi:hypothetical protein C2G38_2161919 [Gigaspora rosea]|uniref:Uncharacterized protein n=1 Tax=Gigaspora rosea TaxID=44941 RepID=A0A397VWH7_9GLOM|nr:hypothetical protein C2G38_2161919 [Gigaspora rosea]